MSPDMREECVRVAVRDAFRVKQSGVTVLGLCSAYGWSLREGLEIIGDALRRGRLVTGLASGVYYYPDPVSVIIADAGDGDGDL